jgi:ribosome maturation factor RimP
MMTTNIQTTTTTDMTTAHNSAPNANKNTQTIDEQLIELLTPLLSELSYELVHVEFATHPSKTIRVYIDRLSGDEGISIGDCAKVSRALDEPLEKFSSEHPAIANGYELEVSSPGIDRPLRKISDFQKFCGREARLHVFRPLTAEELSNSEYQARNPKQKNFVGMLKGVDGNQILLSISSSMGATLSKGLNNKKPGQKPGKTKPLNEKRDEVSIPLALVSKANLEPHFEILGDEK